MIKELLSSLPCEVKKDGTWYRLQIIKWFDPERLEERYEVSYYSPVLDGMLFYSESVDFETALRGAAKKINEYLKGGQQ